VKTYFYILLTALLLTLLIRLHAGLVVAKPKILILYAYDQGYSSLRLN